ncbi:uncharacterized protein LOC119672256 [Teleopsis dalmanni]|uniref:uncharacterized protein LOC119672256 n=1 Tax=Teleopsis dalmanni TaxID=139649 RepID=UPI0018CCBA97|nr:uncharacterized protein LOC119672256 [Teleopsis dalmanni]
MEAKPRTDSRHEIISLVKKNRLLWDKTYCGFSSRSKKRAVWLRISKAVGMSNDKARRIWGNLRDQYRRDLKRSIKGGAKRKWKFCNEMDFLRPMIRVQGKNSELSSAESDNDESCDSSLETQNSTTDKNLLLQSSMLIFPQPEQLEQIENLNTSNQNLTEEYTTTSIVNYSSMLKPANLNASECIPQVLENVSVVERVDNTVKIEIDLSSDDEACIKSENPNEIEEIEIDNSSKGMDNTFSEASNNGNQEMLRNDTVTSQSSKITLPQQISFNHCNINERSIVDTNTSVAEVAQDIQLNTDQVQDEDYHFVISILPHLRKVPSNRKLHVRMAIMNALSNEFN